MTATLGCDSATATPLLSPHTITVRRGDRELQFGLADDVAVTVPLPAEVSAQQMLDVLQRLDGATRTADVLRGCALDGTASAAAESVIEQLSAAGILSLPPTQTASSTEPVRPFRVHLLGSGDMAQRLSGPLSQQGFAVLGSPRPTLDLDTFCPPWRRGQPADVVVLADDLVPDPVVLAALHRHRTPHIYIACRDNRVVVGPTVLPGQTMCLRCADLYRADRNPQWPLVSAQLLWTSGWAPVPSRVAGVALTVSELAALRARADGPSAPAPLTLEHSVELSVAQGVWRRRRWDAHPQCGCGAR